MEIIILLVSIVLGTALTFATFIVLCKWLFVEEQEYPDSDRTKYGDWYDR